MFPEFYDLFLPNRRLISNPTTSSIWTCPVAAAPSRHTHVTLLLFSKEGILPPHLILAPRCKKQRQSYGKGWKPWISRSRPWRRVCLLAFPPLRSPHEGLNTYTEVLIHFTCCPPRTTKGRISDAAISTQRWCTRRSHVETDWRWCETQTGPETLPAEAGSHINRKNEAQHHIFTLESHALRVVRSTFNTGVPLWPADGGDELVTPLPQGRAPPEVLVSELIPSSPTGLARLELRPPTHSHSWHMTRSSVEASRAACSTAQHHDINQLLLLRFTVRTEETVQDTSKHRTVQEDFLPAETETNNILVFTSTECPINIIKLAMLKRSFTFL